MIDYSRHTLGALADAIVPETPDLAAERGDEHGPGALAVGLDEVLVDALNDLQEIQGGAGAGLLRRLGVETVPYAVLVAVLLDLAAIELVVRRRSEEGLARNRGEFATRGPYTALSPRDRLRAMSLLETDGVLARFDDRFHDRVPHLGVVRYLVQAINTIVQLAYYSELTAEDNPSPETVQSWQQTGYPGPTDGYAALLGYELDEFDENEYGGP